GRAAKPTTTSAAATSRLIHQRERSRMPNSEFWAMNFMGSPDTVDGRQAAGVPAGGGGSPAGGADGREGAPRGVAGGAGGRGGAARTAAGAPGARAIQAISEARMASSPGMSMGCTQSAGTKTV